MSAATRKPCESRGGSMDNKVAQTTWMAVAILAAIVLIAYLAT
jgi:hypothetical protein